MTKLHFLALILAITLWPALAARTAVLSGDGTVTLFNTHTQEFETIKYRDGDNAYLDDGVAELNNMLRCRLTGDKAHMSLKLIELVDKIGDHFGGKEIDVISGYRSPTLNAALRASGHRVASHSLHMVGLAMDIKIPGVSLTELRDYVRSLKVGGVGYYSGNFVHVDVGPVRYW